MAMALLMLVSIGVASFLSYRFFIKEPEQGNDQSVEVADTVGNIGGRMRGEYIDWVVQAYNDQYGNTFYFGIPKDCTKELNERKKSKVTYICQISNKETRFSMEGAESSGKWDNKENAIRNYITYKYSADGMKGSSFAEVRKEVEFTNPNSLNGYEVYVTQVSDVMIDAKPEDPGSFDRCDLYGGPCGIRYFRNKTTKTIIELPSFLVDISNNQHPKFIVIEGDEDMVRQVIKTIDQTIN